VVILAVVSGGRRQMSSYGRNTAFETRAFKHKESAMDEGGTAKITGMLYDGPRGTPVDY